MSAAALANLGKQDPIKLGIGAVIVIAALYYLTRATVVEVAQGVGGVVTGNNAVTQNATNASGDATTAYQGAGVLGTLGAATNAASGGLLASAGEALGSAAYDIKDWASNFFNLD